MVRLDDGVLVHYQAPDHNPAGHQKHLMALKCTWISGNSDSLTNDCGLIERSHQAVSSVVQQLQDVQR
jgi:hypothetical protein